jgi:hypothetical protein
MDSSDQSGFSSSAADIPGADGPDLTRKVSVADAMEVARPLLMESYADGVRAGFAMAEKVLAGVRPHALSMSGGQAIDLVEAVMAQARAELIDK